MIDISVPELNSERLEFEELRKKLVAYVTTRTGEKRKGKGFSIGELKAINLPVKKAIKLGVPVDLRRKTNYEENIATLKSIDWNRYKTLAKKFLKKKKQRWFGHKHRKRVFRGLTSAGKKMRGLRSQKLRHTHKHKWKKKQKEREEGK